MVWMIANDPTKSPASGLFSRSATLAELRTKSRAGRRDEHGGVGVGRDRRGQGLAGPEPSTLCSTRPEQALHTPSIVVRLPAGLVESELFGHERGAFTGAVTRRIGFFERAHRGTLFLDEIGDLPLESQRVLLHVLEEKRLTRLGGKASIPVDVRIIAATNRHLQRAVEEGTFRADLYYRLRVFPLVVPPLRARREDIPLLAAHFVRQYAQRFKCPEPRLGDGVMEYLQAHAWPGNVRELAHRMQRAVIVCEGARIELTDVLAAGAEGKALSLPVPASSVAQGAAGEDEKQRIVAALERANWVVSGDRGAARLLGMTAQTLRYRMRKYGIQRPPKSS